MFFFDIYFVDYDTMTISQNCCQQLHQHTKLLFRVTAIDSDDAGDDRLSVIQFKESTKKCVNVRPPSHKSRKVINSCTFNLKLIPKTPKIVDTFRLRTFRWRQLRKEKVGFDDGKN